MTASGKPVEDAELRQELLQATHNTGKRVDLKWIPGKKGVHAKAVDKLAKLSAKGHLNEPLIRGRVRRSKVPNQVEVGSVGMDGQTMTVYVRAEKRMAVQRCYRYRYEVLSEDSVYFGLVDDIVSDAPILLSAGHIYSVKVNRDQGNPRVVEPFGEVADPRLGEDRS